MSVVNRTGGVVTEDGRTLYGFGTPLSAFSDLLISLKVYHFINYFD